MGIFNRSIPTYTVDTANKLRITTPVEEPEQQSTYIDDAFDPIFNKAVRDRLMKEWGDPISATAAGYYELLDNSIVGSTKEWGALGSGMGILSSFGRTMDKGGDLVLGTLTEGIKGVTGQGVESPFHNIFVKDQDYSGGRILAAMGNSMAKLANAPQLTEKDFGGAWTIPSIGIELATDPGILGGVLSKAGGAVGNLSTAEVLSNIGRAGHSPLADVGQLLSNYDDAMSKIALDVTAPGTRWAINKFMDKASQLFEHSSYRNLRDTEINPNATPEDMTRAYEEFVHDAPAQTLVHMINNMDDAEAKAMDLKAKKAVDPDVRHDLEKPFIELYSEVASKLDDKNLLDLYKLHNGENVVTSDRVLTLYNKFKAYDTEYKGKLSKAPQLKKTFDRLYNIKNLNDADRVPSKLTADQIPDSVKKLKNLKPRLVDKFVTPTKRRLNSSNFNRNILDVMRSGDAETRRTILKHYKMSVPEYKRLREQEASFKKATGDIRNKYTSAVNKQNLTIKYAIDEAFDGMSLKPTSYIVDDSDRADVLLSLYGSDPKLIEKVNSILTNPSFTNPDYAEAYEYLFNNEVFDSVYDDEIKNYIIDYTIDNYERTHKNSLNTSYKTWQTPDMFKYISNYHEAHHLKNNKYTYATFRKLKASVEDHFGVHIPYTDFEDLIDKYYRIYANPTTGTPYSNIVRNEALQKAAIDDARAVYDNGVPKSNSELESVFYDIDFPTSLHSAFYKSQNAPFTISPSIHKMSNPSDIAVPGVRYAQNTFAKLMSDFNNFGITNKAEFWDFINKNPELRLALMPEYQRKRLIEDIKTIFKTKTGKDLNIDFNDISVMRQVMDTVLSDPELYTALNFKNLYIDGLNDALFGKYDTHAKSYTYQNQFVALNNFTKTIEQVLGSAIAEDVAAESLYENFKGLFKELNHLTDAEFIYRPELWYTETLHNALKQNYSALAALSRESNSIPDIEGIEALMGLIPDDYTKALNWMQNIGINTLRMSETKALYSWAKQMQDEVFLPVQFKARGSFTTDYKAKGKHIGVSKAGMSDESGDTYDQFGVHAADSNYLDDADGDSMVFDAGFSIRNTANDSFESVNSFSAVDSGVLNSILRANRDKFRSIEDIKTFIERLNPYFEFKIKPSELLNLNVKGSNVPDAVRRFLKKYDPEHKKLPFIDPVTPEDKIMLSIKNFLADVDRSKLKEGKFDRFGNPKRDYVETVNKERLEILKRIARLNSDSDVELYKLFRPLGDYTKYDGLVDVYTRNHRKPDINDMFTPTGMLFNTGATGYVVDYHPMQGGKAQKMVRHTVNGHTTVRPYNEVDRGLHSMFAFRNDDDYLRFIEYAKLLQRPDDTTLNRLSTLFTNVDLAPEFIKPDKLESERIVGRALFPKTAKVDTNVVETPTVKDTVKSVKPPIVPSSEVIEKEVSEAMKDLSPETAADMAVSPPSVEDEALHTLAEDRKVADVLDSARLFAEEFKTSIEGLPPEAIERLDLMYGKEKVRLFQMVNQAVVSVTKGKWDKDNALQTKIGHVIGFDAMQIAKSDKKAANRIQMYDAIQTAERGDIVLASKLADEVLTAGGYVGITFNKSEADALNRVIAELQAYADSVNKASGFDAFKVLVGDAGVGTNVKIVLNLTEESKLLKKGIKLPTFKDTDFITFESTRELTDVEKAFKASEVYSTYDKFLRRQSAYTQDLYRPLGFDYDTSEVHIKHVKAPDDKAVNIMTKSMNVNLPDEKRLHELSKRLLNTDQFKHLYGTFGIVPAGRSYRGSINRWNFDDVQTFDFDPVRLVNSTFAEGALSNSEVQSFIGLFVNDNFKLKTYFKTPEDLEKVLYAAFEDGSKSGNMSNLTVIAPVYNDSGKVVKFKKFDKTTRAGLEQALRAQDAILVPSSLVAPLDIWCKKDAKMSSKVYRFFNTYFSLPYKFGVLMNPGFLLGNVSDSVLKQFTTFSQKYGTSVPEEMANVLTSVREVMHLNNSATTVYGKVISFFEQNDIDIPPYERPMTALNMNPNARKRVVDFLNGNTVVRGKPVKIEQWLTQDEVDTLRVWMYLNNFQTTKGLGDGFRDISKEGISDNNSFIKRLLYGKKKFSFKNHDWMNPLNWGASLNNPVSAATFSVSEDWEALIRSAEILNSLKHEGLNKHELSKILGEGFDATASERLHIETLNAINTMFNSNFNYDAQSELMHKLSYAVPFPTFFIKNFAYWMELLVNNPEYIDTALTIQEGLWNDREEEVKEDRFMAEAKGRGAIPISDGDNKGLSKLFKGIYKPTPLNSMFGAFNLLNNPIEDLTNRVHPLINAPLQMLQAEMGQRGIGLATPEDAKDVKYRPYSMDKFEKNIPYTSPDFDWREYLFHKLNPHDRAMSNAMRLPHKLGTGDVQLADVLPSVFQPDF